MSAETANPTKSSIKPIMSKIRLKTIGIPFKCCAPGCNMDRSKISYSLHPFPNETTEPERHEIWKRLLLIVQPVTRSNVVCARHFPKQSFKHNADGTSSIFLKPDAYPYATSKLKLRLERHRAEREKTAASNKKLCNDKETNRNNRSSGDDDDDNPQSDREVQIIEDLL
ncbi:AAEL008821-PA [Aedes aegypti]|uniref:THAP-type domain-containing protein n=2 Tax=Aedes aegypti TaxID=7159 RepID=Q16XR8_AEDAE|nr:uncharacterized protein LOC5571061 [Aedes aegypti]XP_021710572.1 uncharacterized protein LOC5571061 [Aedes aegypti]XP_021710573.1 uncharacterized protein LOC5571061 [Aedes aegypti]XP_021710574.1 uncharacterized protein LOC5571061 [Aedes aegypti]EAT39374.1 AAEL008821-PA [Aedes aegypti]